jgi:hypothetical protein
MQALGVKWPSPWSELKIGKEGWMVCNACGARLKAKDTPEHMSMVHPGGH